MGKERLFINDVSRLEEFGFEFYASEFGKPSCWYYNRIRVTEDGFVSVPCPTVDTIMKLIELGKANLIEERTKPKAKKKVQVSLDEDEYEEYKKWKNGK